jgi:hypothetical protein
MKLHRSSGYSRAGGAGDSLYALRSSSMFLPGQGYTTTLSGNRGENTNLAFSVNNRLTFPGQSKHLMRHSGVLKAFNLREIASNLSSGYFSCMACIANDSHSGRVDFRKEQ